MDEKKQEFQVEGFLFQEEAAARQAQREAEGIRYIRERNRLDNPKLTLALYDKILEQKLFETPVGIGYLKEIQTFLLDSGAVSKEQIRPIPVETAADSKNGEVRKDSAGQKQDSKGKKECLGKLRISLALNVVLAAAVIAMFVITLTSKLPTIFNYEQELLNKYSAWEQELSERELKVRQQERELGLKP